MNCCAHIMALIMHCKDRQSGVQCLRPKKARTLISLDTAVWVSVCLGHIPGIPGQLRTALLTLCLYSAEKKNATELVETPRTH